MRTTRHRRRDTDGALPGPFRLDVVLVRQGEAGGGGYRSVVVRLCARLAGVVGPPGTVESSDVACPAGLPDTVPDLGEVEKTVTLA